MKLLKRTLITLAFLAFLAFLAVPASAATVLIDWSTAVAVDHTGSGGSGSGFGGTGISGPAGADPFE